MNSISPPMSVSSDVSPPNRTPDGADVIRALGWRFVRHGWRHVLPSLLILCGVPTLLYVLLRLIDQVVVDNLWQDGIALRRIFFMLEPMAVLSLVVAECARIRSLYTLPLRTRQIVHVQLGLGIVAAIGLHWATVAYFQIVFGAPIPVFGPLLFLIPGLLIAAGISALLVDVRWWKLLTAIIVFMWLGYSAGVRFNDPELALPGSAWFTPSLEEMLVLMALAVAGYFFTVHTASLDRRGETQPWSILEEYLLRLTGLLLRGRPSPEAAPVPSTRSGIQFLFEWRTKGLVLPIVAAGLGIISLVGAYYDPLEWFQGYTKSLPVLVMLGFTLNGYFVGLMDGSKGHGQMDHYRATRPLTDTQLAAASIKNGLAGTMVALGITILLAALVYGYARLCGHANGELWAGLGSLIDNSDRPGIVNYLGAFVALTILGWAGFGFNLATVVTGRHWLTLTVWVVGVSGLIMSIMVAHHLSEEQSAFVRQLALGTLGIVAVASTVIIYWRAIDRGLIPPRIVVAGAAMAVVAALFLAAAVRPHLSWQPAIVLALAGLGALVALPPASVPLAVSWNRHR